MSTEHGAKFPFQCAASSRRQDGTVERRPCDKPSSSVGVRFVCSHWVAATDLTDGPRAPAIPCTRHLFSLREWQSERLTRTAYCCPCERSEREGGVNASMRWAGGVE
eukprot:6135216-Pleurochrysis_carterae.AAC.1